MVFSVDSCCAEKSLKQESLPVVVLESPVRSPSNSDPCRAIAAGTHSTDGYVRAMCSRSLSYLSASSASLLYLPLVRRALLFASNLPSTSSRLPQYFWRFGDLSHLSAISSSSRVNS